MGRPNVLRQQAQPNVLHGWSAASAPGGPGMAGAIGRMRRVGAPATPTPSWQRQRAGPAGTAVPAASVSVRRSIATVARTVAIVGEVGVVAGLALSALSAAGSSAERLGVALLATGVALAFLGHMVRIAVAPASGPGATSPVIVLLRSLLVLAIIVGILGLAVLLANAE